MTLTLYVSPEISEDRLRLVSQLGLLPKPQAVRYGLIVQAAPSGTFGFSNNVDSVGFASKFDPAYTGGYLARKVII